jgi:secreted PhoX family phosphatase
MNTCVKGSPADFEFPDNLALDKNGNLYIAEDPATAPTTGRGDDIWVAVASNASHNTVPLLP